MNYREWLEKRVAELEQLLAAAEARFQREADKAARAESALEEIKNREAREADEALARLKKALDFP